MDPQNILDSCLNHRNPRCYYHRSVILSSSCHGILCVMLTELTSSNNLFCEILHLYHKFVEMYLVLILVEMLKSLHSLCQDRTVHSLTFTL